MEDKNAFLVEVQQAGIFFAAGIDEEPLKQLLATVAPNIQGGEQPADGSTH
jgi:preprotein translocase subunit SecB